MHRQEYERERNKLPHRIEQRRQHALTPEGKAQHNAATKRYRESNPERYKATNAVNNALRDGKLVRPDECEDCGKKCKPHGHHEDYSKMLDVNWLCTTCHRERHK